MRYGKDQKPATRQRILVAAGKRFKEHGLDGTGIAGVMSDAGLTNGAFYAHFASKEDLIANVLIDQLRTQRAAFAQAPDGAAGLRAIFDVYLSPAHRDDAASGCPSAALLNEVARCPATTRATFTDELLAIAGDIAERLPESDDRRLHALQLVAFMVGTLQVSRALSDTDLSDQLLHTSAGTVERLAGVGSAPPGPPSRE